MAVRLLMSPEQYAAMQFCGCEMNLKIKSDQNVQFDPNKKSEVQAREKIIIDNQIRKTPLPQSQELEDQINEQIMNMLDYKESKAQTIKINKQAHTIFNRDKNMSDFDGVFQEEEDTSTHRQNNLIEKHDYFQQQASLQKIQTNTQNHLQVIEDMLSNTDNLFLSLKKFIDKLNDPKQKLSQTDTNIYSSLIGLNQNILAQQEI
ncbi:phosphatidylserine decarboxylase family protein, putative (macronuclear) [Tetrahymena thermophila SB210]|uniref:Phosphatidylserine decarboxylase family protein, putative n=1 Tax=Tetrahymena thermophila (strain SB210) TaxID=312017 RepID=I7M0Q7_TETTS|nr:phosphatidylserine decarboxylase family protein, putative [Tetrahymena thermophila SB210]EAR90755.2 phosphatidylserine decarboxylase family protein, putative [Tetrahymena thermophila SB210]|eukprot:XP_001011000.2 phosphatidylserine decarboxylase family protein, putative [Tetrahymena thermophila SB210]